MADARHDPAVEPLPGSLADALASPAAHPADPSARAGVEVIHTHLSLVFLTGERAYKFRKAVGLGFADFHTRALRDADCLREVALNRRLAPGVYLGVAALERGPAGLRVGPVGETLSPGALEHCVVMRRLPEGRDALSLLERGSLRARHVDRVAERLAGFHRQASLGAPAPFEPQEWLARITGPVAANFESLHAQPEGIVPPALLEETERRGRAFVAEHAGRFEARRRAGRAVDGHGDVHLQHVWFPDGDGAPLLVDCIEFNEGLRRIDAASEVAFLAMDLDYRGAAALARRFLRRYARAADDFDLYGVVDYYQSYRAGVRAKVAGIAAADPAIDAEQREAATGSVRRHLELAHRALAPRAPGDVVIVCGRAGTGKTSVAEELAEVAPGVVIASDRVRKALAGLPPTASAAAAPGAGLYADRHRERVYQALLERAAPVVEAGRTAILDATYARAAWRARVHAWARERGVCVRVLETRCPDALALERLVAREREGTSASDAGREVFLATRDDFEPVAPDEPGAAAPIDTGSRVWRLRVREWARRQALKDSTV